MRQISEKRKTQLSELEQIRGENDGLLPPRAVVEFARDPLTALHGEFTWDDAVAAEERRLDQARRLIRVMVTIEHIADKDRRVRAFVSVMDDRRMAGGGYRSTVEVMQDDERRERMLATALMELRAFKRRYSVLQELASVFEAAEEVLSAHSRKEEGAASGLAEQGMSRQA